MRRSLIAWVSACGLLLAALWSGPVSAVECPVPDDVDRTLVLALDGIPFRLIEEAREQGAFAAWDTPRPLVSTFPSVTNVAFTAMFAPFGVEPAGGYEVQFFDWEENSVLGGHPWGYNGNLFAWREVFDFTSKTVGGKLSIYTNPAGNAWKEVDEAEALILDTDQELILAHAGATDAMLHLKGEPAVLKVLLELDGRLQAMRERYREARGSDLRIILLSDHGNTDLKVKSANGVRKKLKKAGLRPWPHLEEPNGRRRRDIRNPELRGALHPPGNGEVAATAMVQHKTVDLAVWRSGPEEIGVVAKTGSPTAKLRRAAVRWKDFGGERLYAYVPQNGDPPPTEACPRDPCARQGAPATTTASSSRANAHGSRRVSTARIPTLRDASSTGSRGTSSPTTRP